MKFKSMISLISLLAIAVQALPTPMSDCDMCIGIVQQYRRSPTSLVMCSDDRCKNITQSVMNIVLNPYYESEYYTPEEICAEVNYCVEFDSDPPPVIILEPQIRQIRRTVSVYEDLAGGDVWGEFP